MLRKKLALWTVCLLSLFCFNTSAQAIDISEVVITADNAFLFGWGTVNNIPNTIVNFHPGVFESQNQQIFQNGAEKYFTNAPITVTVDDYFYIIAHSDEATTQGVIAEVKALAPFKNLLSGQGAWEVYATGIDFSGNNFPTRQQINTQIDKANNVQGDPTTTSRGWVNAAGQVVDGQHVVQLNIPVDECGRLAIGEENGTPTSANLTGVFQRVYDMSAPTKWMWYNPDPDHVTNPFSYNVSGGLQCSTKGHKEYLIFRLAAKLIPGGDCCTTCCDNFKSQFYDPVHFKVDEKTGQGSFFQSFNGKAVGGLKAVSASIVSSSAVSCNGTVSSLGLHFRSPTPVTGWTDQLTHPPYSHEITWCRDLTTKSSTFILQQPLALTIPVSELKCAQTIKFCIKYTFTNMKCQACEVIKCYEFSYSELMGGLPRLAQGKRQPTMAPPRPVRSPVITPVKVKTPVRRPMELRPTIRTLTPRPDPRPAPRPPIDVRPVKVQPVEPRPETERPLLLKPQDQVKPVDLEKDPRKPVVEQPADGKDVPQKSDREKPAVKKPAERKEAEAKRVADESANRSVLLKKLKK